jgi:hypothetical protein
MVRAARDRKVQVLLLSALCLMVGVWLGSRVTRERVDVSRVRASTAITTPRPAADGRAWTSRIERELHSVADGGPLALRGAEKERAAAPLARAHKASPRRDGREAKRAASSKVRSQRHAPKATRVRRRGH